MRELSLFTGAGGGLLGSLILGWEPMQFVEHDAYCQRVLAARFPDAPCHDDVRDFHPAAGLCDIVTGGFPCQPFSQAGKRLGEDDPRNMWPHAVRVLRESGAPLGFFENVPGLLSSGYFGTILGDLAEAGFDAEWCVLGADDVGAPHRRKRLWILAYRDGAGAGVQRGAVGEAARGSGRDAAFDVPSGRGEVSGGSPWWCDPADVAHPGSVGQPGPWSHGDASDTASSGEGQRNHALDAGEPGRDEWLLEPYVGRVATGVASRVDRLRALGNGQVPFSMAGAWATLADSAGLL